MSLKRFHFIAITCWFVALVAVLAARIALDIPTSLAMSVALLLLGALPPAILLAVFRGASDRNMTQVLYDTEQAGVPVPVRARVSRPRFPNDAR